jgi:hypothetical protein
VVTFDADGQHRAADVERLLQPLLAGRADVVLGSRFLGASLGVPWVRRWLLRAAVAFTRLVSGVRVTDVHNGLRAFNRDAASKLDFQLDRMAHASELFDQIRRCGLRYLEVPVSVDYTSYSLTKGQRSSAALRIVWDYLLGKILD